MTRVKNAACSCCGAGGPLQLVPVVAKADPTVRTTDRALRGQVPTGGGRRVALEVAEGAARDYESGGCLMAITTKNWQDFPSTSTPLTASSLLDPEVREAAKDQVRAAAP